MKASKKILVVLIALIFSNGIYAQDLIVNTKGDSLNCKISSITVDYYHFSIMYKKAVRNTKMSANQVVYHEYNYFQKLKMSKDSIKALADDPFFRLAFHGGLSIRTASSPDNITPNYKKHIQQLRSGVVFGTDAHWFTSETIGFGARANLYISSAYSSNVSFDLADGTQYTGRLDEKVTMQYIGPSLNHRIMSFNKQNAFYTGASLGYLGYRNTINNRQIRGNAVGLLFDIGYDIGISKDVAIGFSLTWVTGVLSSINVNPHGTKQIVKLEDDQKEGLGRIDLTMGIRFLK